jgi:hypothetical protein
VGVSSGAGGPTGRIQAQAQEQAQEQERAWCPAHGVQGVDEKGGLTGVD